MRSKCGQMKNQPHSEKPQKDKKRTGNPLSKRFPVPLPRVDATGFEPAASASRTQRSTKLSHASKYLLSHIISNMLNYNTTYFLFCPVQHFYFFLFFFYFFAALLHAPSNLIFAENSHTADFSAEWLYALHQNIF